jgi:hypothetical protein
MYIGMGSLALGKELKGKPDFGISRNILFLK